MISTVFTGALRADQSECDRAGCTYARPMTQTAGSNSGARLLGRWRRLPAARGGLRSGVAKLRVRTKSLPLVSVERISGQVCVCIMACNFTHNKITTRLTPQIHQNIARASKQLHTCV